MTEDVLRGVMLVAWSGAALMLVNRPGLRELGRLVLLGVLAGAVAFIGREVVGAHIIGEAALVAVAFHVLVSLPRGTITSAALRRVVVAGYVVAAATAIAAWVGPGHWPAIASAGLWALALGVGLPLANRVYRSTAGLDRQRLQWIGCAGAVLVGAAFAIVALNILVDWPRRPVIAIAAATLVLPPAFAAGSSRLVTRVDRILVHVVSATGLTVVVVSVYLLFVVGLGRLPDEGERGLLALSMVAAAVAAGLYQPARDRLADIANRVVYGERHAPDEALRTFGSRLSRAVPMDELLLQLAESLRKSMTLTSAEVWTGSPQRLEQAVSVPDREREALTLGTAEAPVVARAGVSGNAWISVWIPALLVGRVDRQVRVAPICHSGEILGLIVVEREADGDAFGEEEDQALAELARQVGLALHNVVLDSALQASLEEVRRQADELRASRARIVATADAERRKIERNLHDGAQQHLVALAVNLRLARDIIAEDAAAGAELLEALADGVKDTIQELRDLAHGIYPPLLMDSGLPEALKAAGNRSPLEVTVDTDGVGRYPTEVEAAVYFCCLEALQNAAKHAPGSRVEVRVRAVEDPVALTFEVSDDGPGFDVAAARAGHGYVNMTDRLGAIGGTVTWESSPGEGARVRGSIPAAPVAA